MAQGHNIDGLVFEGTLPGLDDCFRTRYEILRFVVAMELLEGL